jgi:hypothetical protein
LLLQVNPNLRPDATQLLQLPIVQQKERMYMNKAVQIHLNQSQTHQELLKTIIFPKNLSNMHQRVPAPRYYEAQSDDERQGQSGSFPNATGKNNTTNNHYLS